MTLPDPLDARIQAYLDGRLDEDERRRLEGELADDPELRERLDALRWVSTAAREALEDEMPTDLTARIRAALDRVDAESAVPRPASAARWPAALAVAAVLAVVAIGWFAIVQQRTVAPDATALPLVVAADVHDYVEGRLALTHETVDVEEMERFFAEQGIRFPTRVFDLQMMDLHLVGGVKHEMLGRDSAAFVYRGPADLRVLCQMYPGNVDELPPAEDVREHNGITFYSYEVDCVSMTFWREGDVICVLAAMGDLEQVVALAFAKAVRV